MEDNDTQQQDEVRVALRSMRRRIGALTLAVIVMALMLALTAAAVFGYLVEFHGGEAALIGGGLVGGALLGFVAGLTAGWIARRQV